MRKSLQLIYLLRNTVTGILAPVLALTLLRHGADLHTLPLMIGAYSFTVICAEFPSGLLADRYGRKTAFVFSVLLDALSYGLLLIARHGGLLLLGLVLNGLGRAFASGSLEALAMDGAPDAAGIVRVSGQFNLLGSAGLAAGSLAGGVLAGLGSMYAGNLSVNLLLCILLVPLTVIFVHEEAHGLQPHRHGARVAADAPRRLPGLRWQVRQSIAHVVRHGNVRILFVLAFVTGIALAAVEVYWQPALTEYAPPAWTFGVVSFMAFGSVMLGSKVAEKHMLARPKIGLTLLLAQKALLGIAVLALALPRRAWLFLGAYLGAYAFLGMGNVAETALLNRDAPSAQRAGILSLFSLTGQLGGLFTSIGGYVISLWLDYRLLWLLAGVLLTLTAGVLAIANAAGVRRGKAFR